MTFGYKFINLNDEQKKSRRELLEYYPFVAQVSVLLVFVLLQFGFFLSWLSKRGLDYERPRSPSIRKREDGTWTWLRKSQQGCDRMAWWLRRPLIANWGSRGEWLVGGSWAAWLLFLCVVNTGNGESCSWIIRTSECRPREDELEN